MKILNIMCAVLITAGTLVAQVSDVGDKTYTIDIVATIPEDHSALNVDFGHDQPANADLTITNNWSVRVIELATGIAHTVNVDTVELRDIHAPRLVPRLHLLEAVNPATQKIVVGYALNGHYFEAAVGDPKPLKPRRFVGASGKDDAQFYLKGTASAAQQASPLYSVSAKANYLHPVNSKQDWGWWGINASLEASEETNADPDSITASANYLIRISIWNKSFWELQVDPLRGEFDRKGKYADFVPSGSALLVLHPVKLASKSFLAVYFGAGLEGGRSYKNATSLPDYDVFRVVPKMDVAFKSFKPWNLTSIALDTNFELRLPQDPEPFTHKVNGSAVTFAGTNPRPHVVTTLDFMFTEYAGLSLGYEYGSLPPTFKLVNNKVSAGLVIKLKQKR